MDYSLLVMIIDWDQYLKDKEGEEDESAVNINLMLDSKGVLEWIEHV